MVSAVAAAGKKAANLISALKKPICVKSTIELIADPGQNMDDKNVIYLLTQYHLVLFCISRLRWGDPDGRCSLYPLKPNIMAHSLD